MVLQHTFMPTRFDETCRFESDQTFSSLQGTDLETMSVVDGTWYVYLMGDYAGRVSGAVYDLRNSSDPVKLVTTVSDINCFRMHGSSSVCMCTSDAHVKCCLPVYVCTQ